jgi:alcohol dehydrogenase (cytochrome c)
MTGGSALAILQYVRYHTDAEMLQVLGRHTARVKPALSDDERRQVLADIRKLAGTNPTMATGGYTGRRSSAGSRYGGPPEAGPAGGPAAITPSQLLTAEPVTIKLTDGQSLTGLLTARSDFEAALLADGRYRLLTKEGEAYREKPIEPKADWLHYDGSYTGNRYSSLDQINPGNVSRLAPAWFYPMPKSQRLEVTPVVMDGVMYVVGWNEIAALDATTGRELWAHSEPRHDGILSEGGAGANRGAAIGGDRVFMVTDHAHLLAFNRFTGEKVWDAEMGSLNEGYSATAAPLAIGDLVIAGVAGGEEGARGFLDAYRISSGERVWRFYTIPKRGEKGSETWIGQALEHGCGATWLTGAFDPVLDTLYWTIGNPCPDYTGDERLGDNLYTNSVVALAARTGELKWYYQFSPHDTHDWDANTPVILADEMWNGQPRKLLIHGDRNGMFYVFDRMDGRLLLVDNLVTKVTWHKGFGEDGKPIVDPASVSTRDGVAVCPAGGGGPNWPAASFNLITKLFYIRSADSCGLFASHHDPLGTSGDRWFGRGTPGEKAKQALARLLEGYKTGTFIRAMDPFTGKKVWDYPAPPGRSGVLSTAGGLVFLGGGSGLMALGAKSGQALWNVNIGHTTQAGPMTYMVGGRQYVSLPGNGVIVAYRLY